MQQSCISIISVAPQTTKPIRNKFTAFLTNDFAEAFVNITGNKVSAPIRHPPDAPKPVSMVNTNLTADYMTTGLKTKQITHHPLTPLPLRYDPVAIIVKVSHICALLPKYPPSQPIITKLNNNPVRINNVEIPKHQP
jgi:hypothetical protein